MKSLLTQSPRLVAEVFLWRHGWALPLAIALGAAALLVEACGAAPARSELQAASAIVQPLPRSAAQASTASAARDLQRTEPSMVLARMLELAQAQGINLAQGEYQRRDLPGASATQMQIVQPLRATYPQMRRFVESVLREMPTVSLDVVHARRESVANGQLDIRLQWSLWLPPAAAAQEAR